MPLLFFQAVIPWCVFPYGLQSRGTRTYPLRLLPIASNITPGTLSVGTGPVSPVLTVQQQVPNVGFESLNYVNSIPHKSSQEDSQTVFNYNGPSVAVERTVTDVLATGFIQPINIQYLNASWTLDFTGPGLSCSDVRDSLRTRTEDQLISTHRTSGSCVTKGVFAWKDRGIPLSSNVSISFNKPNHGSIALNLVAISNFIQVDKSLKVDEPGTTDHVPICL